MTYYVRRLPHWHPEAAWLFVTWRLYGSLPRNPTRHTAHRTPGEAFAAMDRVLDRAQTGPRWLAEPRVAELVQGVILRGQHARELYELRAWVIMPNPVHVLVLPRKPLAGILRDIKSASAREANAMLGRAGQAFWQDESYDHWVRNEAEKERIVHYIEGNPVRAGLAGRAEDFRWSSGWAGHGPAPLVTSS